MEQELKRAVMEAAGREEVCRAVGEIYDELAAAIAERRPVCSASGRCCKFEEYGHRLYLTTMELAKFFADLKLVAAPIREGQATLGGFRQLPVLAATRVHSKWDGLGCPFQIEGLCGVHAIRPFGCRVYFCDASSTQWQHDQYERLHGRLRALHDRLAVPYHYVEWRFALAALGLSDRGETWK